MMTNDSKDQGREAFEDAISEDCPKTCTFYVQGRKCACAGSRARAWERLFDRVACELGCLPSAFVDGNDHVFEKLAELRAYVAPADDAPPDGFNSWKDAAINERLRRVKAERKVGELDPHDALRYAACRESAIERGLFATPEEYDAMVDDSLRKKGKEPLTGRGHNYGKKMQPNGTLVRVATSASALARDEASVVKLAVWYGPMPESNGKTNWTAILHKGDLAEGHTIDRSEYPDRVRYAADCVRYLIGELPERPWILDYDADKHSDYVAASSAATVSDAASVQYERAAFGDLLAAARAVISDGHQHDVGGGDVFISTCDVAEKLERAVKAIDDCCPVCGQSWDEHEFAVPAPYCPPRRAASSATAPLTSDSEADPRILAEQWHGRFLNKCGYPPDAEDGYASGYRDGLARAQSTNGEQS